MKRTPAKAQALPKRKKSPPRPPGHRPTRRRPTRAQYVRELEKDHAELKQEKEALLESQAELEASRDRYLDLYDNAPVCFISLTSTGIIKDANRPAIQLLKYSLSHLRGWPFSQAINKSDHRKFLDHLVRCRQHFHSAQPLAVELQLKRHAGQEPVFIELISFSSGQNSEGVVFKSVFRDITGIKQMEEVHRWLAAIVESSSDAIIGKDLTGHIISCNQGASNLLGYSREELIGRPEAMLLPPELHAEETRLLGLIRRGEKIDGHETVRRHKNGTLVPVSLTLSPIRDRHAKIAGISSIARDISKGQQAEHEVQQSLAREKAAREAAEAANRAKDDFLAALSHELRTPLNPVLLLASEAAANRDLPPRVRADFANIRKNVELEARLIDDLLDLTRVTREKLTLERENRDAHVILQDAIATVKNELNEKQISLELDLGAYRHRIFGDAVRCQQIFWNVLKNAVKYTPVGGRISVTTGSADNKLSVQITDTGIGLTPAEIENLFKAFSQGKHSFGGLGLGLAISRALVEMHAGTIRAESAGRNKGATFVIEFPLVKSTDKAEAVSEPPATRTPSVTDRQFPATNVRVLLVEDHEPTRTALTHLLSRRHYKVSSAGSLAEARSLVKGQEDQQQEFNLLISDLGLPDGNGCDLMAELHKNSQVKGIALTGYGMEQDVNRCLEVGFTAHLTKPVSIELLDKALASALNR